MIYPKSAYDVPLDGLGQVVRFDLGVSSDFAHLVK